MPDHLEPDTQEIPAVAVPERHRAVFVATQQRRRQAHLVARGLMALAFLAVIGGAAAVGTVVVQHMTSAPPGQPAGRRTISARSTGNSGRSGSTTSTSSRPTSTSTSTSTATSTTTTTVAASGPGAPHLTAVTPPAAGPGAVVWVHGSGLVSADGIVLARVDGQATRTDCPSRDSCEVTIPPLPRSHQRVPITVTTSGGRSNSLSFYYQ